MKDRIEIKKAGTTYYLDGKEVTEKEYRKRYPLPESGGGAPMAAASGAWPMLSDALAVHPKQVKEAMERDARHGIHTDYAPDGRAILRDRDHRRRMMKSLGIHDRDGGYGDG